MQFTKSHYALLFMLIISIAVATAGCSDDNEDDPVGPEGTWSWSGFGDGIVGEVYAIEVMGDDIFIGGDFSAAGEERINYVRRWDGTSWVGMGDGLSWPVYDMIEYNGQLVACGSFGRTGQTQVYGVAVWDGTQWNGMGDGLVGAGKVMEVVDGVLYVGVESVGSRSIKYWSGDSWIKIDSVPVGDIADMCEFNNSLVAAMRENVDGYYEGFIRTWDGSDWSDWPDPERSVFELCNDNGRLLIGGGGTLPVEVYENSGWEHLDPTAAFEHDGQRVGTVECMTHYDGKLLVAGEFDYIDSVWVGAVATWDDSTWSGLGVGIDGGANPRIMAVDVEGDRLYVGGEFVTAGGDTVNNVAMWGYETE